MFNLGDVLSKLVYSNESQTWPAPPSPPVAMGIWGQSPKPLGNFWKLLEKKAILLPLDHISHWLTAI